MRCVVVVPQNYNNIFASSSSRTTAEQQKNKDNSSSSSRRRRRRIVDLKRVLKEETMTGTTTTTTGAENSSNLCSSKSKVLEWKTLKETKWLKFSSITYRDPTGKERIWDAATRTTKDFNAVADAVCVFAKLKSSKRETQTLLVRQFRPPLECETIELPAGLIDKGETAEEAALRELKEETGYTGYNARATPCSMALSPGLSNETVVLVTVDVNLDEYDDDDDANDDDPKSGGKDKVVPEQELEGSEFITVIKVPLNKMRESLDSLNSSGYKIFAGLYMFALGLEMNDTG